MRLSCLTAAIVIGVLALSRPSAAHTDLLSSSPADGATLATPPRHVELEFTEPMTPSLATIMLTMPGGQPVQLPVRSGPRDTVLLTDVPTSAAPEGMWRVGYRVTSVDGHPIQGKIEFKVTPAALVESVPPGDPSASEPSASESIVAKTPATPGAATPPTTNDTAERESGSGWGWAGPALMAGAVILLMVVVLRSRGTRPGGADQAASGITSSDGDDVSDQPPEDYTPRNPTEDPAS